MDGRRSKLYHRRTTDIVGKIALHVECSGHERAILEGAKAVRFRGKVVLVGVPWQKRTDIPAFELLHAIFHRRAVVRSVWEWEVPFHSTDFVAGSPNNGGVKLDSGKYEAKVGIDRLVARYQILMTGLFELFKLI